MLLLDIMVNIQDMFHWHIAFHSLVLLQTRERILLHSLSVLPLISPLFLSLPFFASPLPLPPTSRLASPPLVASHRLSPLTLPLRGRDRKRCFNPAGPPCRRFERGDAGQRRVPLLNRFDRNQLTRV